MRVFLVLDHGDFHDAYSFAGVMELSLGQRAELIISADYVRIYCYSLTVYVYTFLVRHTEAGDFHL